jgi:hypothetical protein
VQAIAYGPGTISKWTVCLDDQPAYQTDTVASSISQAIDIPAGQHLLYARAWDAQGDSNRSEVALIQVGPPPPSNTVLPTAPANAQVVSEMQNDTANWGICSLGERYFAWLWRGKLTRPNAAKLRCTWRTSSTL